MRVKKVLFYNFDSGTNVKMFSDLDLAIGDDLLLPIKKTKVYLAEFGVDCYTSSNVSFNGVDLFVILDLPKSSLKYVKLANRLGIPVVLIHLEGNAMINNPFSKNGLIVRFSHVLSWYSPYKINFGEKFSQIHYTYDSSKITKNSVLDCRIVCISGNKFSFSKNELYSLRRKWIFEFNEKYPHRFDLYGFGWNLYIFEGSSILSRILNRLNFKFKLFKQHLHVYKGSISRKREVLGNYTFGLVIENEGEKYWLTEKIWDCFINGVIPVYKGCVNIEDYIPSDCYINLDSFETCEELLLFIDGLSEIDIKHYRNSAMRFLNSTSSSEFTNDHFVQTLSQVILKNLS